MSHRPELHDYSSDENAPHEVLAKDLVPTRHREAIKSEIAELVNLEFDRLEENAAYYLTQTAADRAERYIDEILKGNPEAAARLFGDDSHSSRYKQGGHDSGEAWAKVYHGRLFEPEAMKIRREIVEANADLLSNERIKDLESVVEGLRLQINGLEQQLEQTRVRY
jgi:hypothetical protein